MDGREAFRSKTYTGLVEQVKKSDIETAGKTFRDLLK